MVWIGVLVFITGFFMAVAGVIYVSFLLPGIVITSGGLVLTIWSIKKNWRK